MSAGITARGKENVFYFTQQPVSARQISLTEINVRKQKNGKFHEMQKEENCKTLYVESDSQIIAAGSPADLSEVV